MAGLIGEGVSLRGIVPQTFCFTWNVSGTVDRSADIGKAVTLDTTAPNTVKLAGSGDVVLGILQSYEDRTNVEGIKVGTVAHKGGFKVPYVNGASALVPVVGHSVKGSAAGVVMPVAAYDGPNKVVDVDTTNGFVTLVLI